MKTIKTKFVIGFTNEFVSYGKLLTKGKYRIDIGVPEIPFALPLYVGNKKPLFRNITAILILWLPIVIPLIITIVIFIAIIFLVFGFLWFYKTCLFNNSFITDTLDKVSGYFSLVLSIIGLITVIYGIFKLFIL